MNQPVDLYSLQLIRLVAEHRSFSAAAKEAGISQSALSRQIANAELRLELKLFERTTRQVRITEAGAILLRETAAIPNLLWNYLTGVMAGNPLQQAPGSARRPAAAGCSPSLKCGDPLPSAGVR